MLAGQLWKSLRTNLEGLKEKHQRQVSPDLMCYLPGSMWMHGGQTTLPQHSGIKADKFRFRLGGCLLHSEMLAWDCPRGLWVFFLFPSKGNDERKEMERKQEYNLQSRFHSGVMTLVGDDVMGNGLEPISGAGGLQEALYINMNSKYQEAIQSWSFWRELK